MREIPFPEGSGLDWTTYHFRPSKSFRSLKSFFSLRKLNDFYLPKVVLSIYKTHLLSWWYSLVITFGFELPPASCFLISG